MNELNFGSLGTFGWHFEKAQSVSMLCGRSVTFIFGGVRIEVDKYSEQHERFNAYRAALLRGSKYA